MWTAEIQDGNVTVSSTTTGTSNSHKRPLELPTTSSNDILSNIFTSAPECSGDKRQKTTNSCEIHGKKYLQTDHRIKEAMRVRKWQLSNLAKCVFDNTINTVLESLPEETTIRQETLNMASNCNIEDEAVLMAIEEHGLRHQSQCNCSQSSSDDSSCCSNSDSYQRPSSTSTTDTYFSGDDNQEFNFENNFLATAVSAAIEEKGLSMYHV